LVTLGQNFQKGHKFVNKGDKKYLASNFLEIFFKNLIKIEKSLTIWSKNFNLNIKSFNFSKIGKSFNTEKVKNNEKNLCSLLLIVKNKVSHGKPFYIYTRIKLDP